MKRHNLLVFFLLSLSFAGFAEDEKPTTHQTLQVTATKVAEDESRVPVAMTIISGEDLAARGADTLTKALAMVSGVSAQQGGDSGPSGTVPEFWGLREFDAFLLVVDGVPWGGAFNPALTSLNLENVARIEVMRGPAPVMYGATSFVGVIQVIHNQPGSQANSYKVYGGSYGSGGAAMTYNFPSRGNTQHSLTMNANRTGFKDDDTQSDQGQLLYRLNSAIGDGNLHFDADVHFLRQDPASPHPRQGTRLTDLVAIDTNYNPNGAALDQNRLHLGLGYDKPVGSGIFSMSAALTHTTQDNLRGFLGDLDNQDPNAAGYEQDVTINDYYLDGHWAKQIDQVHFLVGADVLAGRGEQESHNFRYYVPLDGSARPNSDQSSPLEDTEMEDERLFGGLYMHSEWVPSDRFRLDVGARLNLTHEKREGEAEPFGEEEEEEFEEAGSETKSISRLSGVLGFSYQLAHSDRGDLWWFADYRNAFKPAAIDFGPEGEHDILEPETADSYEMGLKWHGTASHIMLSAFSQDFENLVISQNVNGFPQLVNAGKERFQGAEIEGNWRLTEAFHCDAAYSYHDAAFRDYERLFDGVPTQLSGNRLELSARHLAAMSLRYFQKDGFCCSAQANYVGSRFLDKRNRSKAGGYITSSAQVCYRHRDWEISLEGFNLSDRRDPVAESELGDAQYYLNPARSFRLSWHSRF